MPSLSLADVFDALDGGPVPVPGGDTLIVAGHRIIGTDTWVFEAWEPDLLGGPRHGTIRRFNRADPLPPSGFYGYHGTVASAAIPDLPTAAERAEALAALQRTSVLAVRSARPDVALLLDRGYGRIDGGRIELALPRSA
jgi:hypothetical protein